MKKVKVWGILSILMLSLFAVGTTFAGDDLPEPLKKDPPATQDDKGI